MLHLQCNQDMFSKHFWCCYCAFDKWACKDERQLKNLRMILYLSPSSVCHELLKGPPSIKSLILSIYLLPFNSFPIYLGSVLHCIQHRTIFKSCTFPHHKWPNIYTEVLNRRSHERFFSLMAHSSVPVAILIKQEKQIGIKKKYDADHSIKTEFQY